MPHRVVSATVGELREVGLETWLDTHLENRDGLSVVGLTYEAGLAGETLVGGLVAKHHDGDDARVHHDGLPGATIVTYPGWLVSDAEGSDGAWTPHGDVSALRLALDHPPLDMGPAPRLELRDPFGFAPYRASVEAIRDGIAAGDYYQVNLARRLEAELDEAHGPALFFALRQAQPAAFSTLWDLGQGWLVSGSPECLLRFDARTRRAHTYPIKGTIGRADNEADDQTLAARLMASEKDRAEHVMIVDLARNDLGRLASKVEVESLYAALPLATLRHLVSDIAADIREDVTLGRLVGALFPGGSITGAPKIAAMNAIAHHEPFVRGFYCGSLGLVFPDEAVFSILIRTAVVSGGHLVYPVGGGLVWDSVAEDEWRETELKAQALLRALGTSPNTKRV